MYGTQAHPESTATAPPFENDVKMYGTQAASATSQAIINV